MHTYTDVHTDVRTQTEQDSYIHTWVNWRMELDRRHMHAGTWIYTYVYVWTYIHTVIPFLFLSLFLASLRFCVHYCIDRDMSKKKESALSAVFFVVMSTTNLCMYELACTLWVPFCCDACSCIGIDISLYPRFRACTRMHAQTDGEKDTCLLIRTHQYIDENLARKFTHTITHTHTGTQK